MIPFTDGPPLPRSWKCYLPEQPVGLETYKRLVKKNMPISENSNHLTPGRTDRKGKRTIAFHVDQELFQRFALVKARYLATTEEMGVIALGLLFKHFPPEDAG